MLLHIPPPSTALEISNAAFYLLTGFAAGILAGLAIRLRSKQKI